jgi:hypothetical protein
MLPRCPQPNVASGMRVKQAPQLHIASSAARRWRCCRLTAMPAVSARVPATSSWLRRRRVSAAVPARRPASRLRHLAVGGTHHPGSTTTLAPAPRPLLRGLGASDPFNSLCGSLQISKVFTRRPARRLLAVDAPERGRLALGANRFLVAVSAVPFPRSFVCASIRHRSQRWVERLAGRERSSRCSLEIFSAVSAFSVSVSCAPTSRRRRHARCAHQQAASTFREHHRDGGSGATRLPASRCRGVSGNGLISIS